MRIDDLENKGVAEIKRYCAQYGIEPMELSRHLQVTFARIYEVLSGKRRITPDTDIRLCQFFKLKSGYFVKKQLEYDLQLTERDLVDRSVFIVPVDKTFRA